MLVVGYPANSMVDDDYRLVGRFDRFEVESSGLAVVEVQWGIGDADGSAVSMVHRSRYTGQVSPVGDPAASARVLSELLWQFGEDIAVEVDTLIRSLSGADDAS